MYCCGGCISPACISRRSPEKQKRTKTRKNKLENKQKKPQNICLVAPTRLKGFELGFKICKSRHFLEACSVSTLGFSLCPTERAMWPSPHFLVFFLSQSTCNPRKQITVAWLRFLTPLVSPIPACAAERKAPPVPRRHHFLSQGPSPDLHPIPRSSDRLPRSQP